MISQLTGTIIESTLEKDSHRVVIDVNGVGYEVFMTKASEGRIPIGKKGILYVCESVTAYDGATTLYGFSSREEKGIFNQVRENVGGMGPKKALECIDKISKSLPDFKRAVIDSDSRLLVSVFGFTKKTADKLIFSLKGKIEGWSVKGPVKWAEAAHSEDESEAISGLLNLGYREEEARSMVSDIRQKLGPKAKTETILQEALRKLGARIG